PGQLGATWKAWFIGDALSDLIVAPLLLAWCTVRSNSQVIRFRAAHWVEAAVLGLALVIACRLIFFGPTQYENPLRRPYVIFPLLIWAAVRFDIRGATTAAFVMSFLATWATSIGRGPFVLASSATSFFFLQTAMAVVAVTTLILAAAMLE